MTSSVPRDDLDPRCLLDFVLRPRVRARARRVPIGVADQVKKFLGTGAATGASARPPLKKFWDTGARAVVDTSSRRGSQHP